MSSKLVLKKATRIEGNADIHVAFDGDRLTSARFQVHEFRGFEKFVSGRRAETVPQLVSRVCGLCSVAHQVAGVRAVENALGIRVAPGVERLRTAMVLAEWINSHALSYFFLTLPDFTGAEGGVFELRKDHPDIFEAVFDLRQAAMTIMSLFGQREMHPVSIGVGRFLNVPDQDRVAAARETAATLKKRLAQIIATVSTRWLPTKAISLPDDIKVHFLALDEGENRQGFFVFDRTGQTVSRFTAAEFEDNIAEMRVDWSLSKIPYVEKLGFPDGIMLVGPLSRSFLANGFFMDPEVRRFDICRFLDDRDGMTLESYDVCRLLEMYWAAGRIESLLGRIKDMPAAGEPDWTTATGQGIGALEAPRGVLIHKYLINRGYVEKARLLVATQFNNAFINLLITDLAQRHSRNGQLTETGSHLIGRCIRLLDPCLSCATH